MEGSKWTREGFTIRDKGHYSESMKALCLAETYSDLILISQEGTRYPAHRPFLAARSDYFSALLYGGLRESRQNEVQILCSEEVLKIVLTFLYSGEVTIGSSEVSFIMTLLKEVRRMFITNLQAALEDLLLDQFNCHKDVINIFDFAVETDFQDIALASRKYLEDFTDDILGSVEYMKLFSTSSFKEFLSGDDLDVPEIEIFRAVAELLNCIELSSEDKKAVLSVVRLNQIPPKQLLREVQPSGLFPDSHILKNINLEGSKENSRKITENENICLSNLGAQVIDPEVFQADDIDLIIKGSDYRSNDRCADWGLGERLEIELPFKQKLNKIKILFHGGQIQIKGSGGYGGGGYGRYGGGGYGYDNRSCGDDFVKVHKDFSYKIESSLDGINWDVVADFSNYKGRLWQTIYFQDKRMKFIGIVGTGSYRKEEKVYGSFGPCCTNTDRTFQNSINVLTVEAMLDTNTEEKERKNTGMKKIEGEYFTSSDSEED